MKMSEIRQRLKPWMLPLAMIAGVLFHEAIEAVAFLAPYLIFIMLFVTFCRVRPGEFRLTGLSWHLLAVQLGGSMAVYLLLRPLSEDLAQGAFICVFCPTATAAPVITGMLGGSVPRLATFSIISNMSVAVLAPMMFALMGGADVEFVSAFRGIAMRVVPLIVAPLGCALVLRAVAPKAHAAVSSRQSVSFYVWAVSLIIVVGRAVSFVMHEPAGMIPEMLALALVSAVVCVGQFVIGRRIGRRYADRVAGAQGLGQKNTVLAIWMALTYLNPIASIAPAAYVAWQNTINSIQIYIKQRHSGN
ncbi:MAG: transporter [Muribaculaceae bacterium]|nr:transporter [Muribaculaceae bacterium]